MTCINAAGRTKLAAIIAGPVIAAAMLVMPRPEGLQGEGVMVAAVVVLMAIWWMTEAVPLAVTALLPLVLFPPLGIAPIDSVAKSYAHPLIFLFLGGFLMAQAMQRWNLNRRVALGILRILRIAGDRPASIVGGIMAATAFLSMWVSNTATAMMMLPIGQSIIQTTAPDAPPAGHTIPSPFSVALMLGIAYAATIGGMGTLSGTPPNALFAGFVADAHGVDIGFARWMLVGIPAVAILLPLAWLVLTRIAFPLPASLPALTNESLDERLGTCGPMAPEEKRVAVMLAIAAIAWVTRPLIERLAPGMALSDAGIAVTMAALLFVVPSGKVTSRSFLLWGKADSHDRPLLTWEEARNIRWDVLILFGGGLALAGMIEASGLAAWIAGKAVVLSGLPWLFVLLAIAAVIVFLGELASNTAMAAIFLPIAAAAGLGIGGDPVHLAMTVALSASLGFMLPVATPPNAIVYGSGALSIQDMIRAGFMLNIVGAVIVALLAASIGVWAFGGETAMPLSLKNLAAQE